MELPKVMIINIKTGKTEYEHEVPYGPSKVIHGQFRRIRYTPRGTFLISYLSMNQVVEYDKEFKEVCAMTLKSPGPLSDSRMAIR